MIENSLAPYANTTLNTLVLGYVRTTTLCDGWPRFLGVVHSVSWRLKHELGVVACSRSMFSGGGPQAG